MVAAFRLIVWCRSQGLLRRVVALTLCRHVAGGVGHWQANVRISDRRTKMSEVAKRPAVSEESRTQQRTRTALFEAFVALVLDTRYDRLKVADIIARAGVARSTFYEHYSSKDDLLAEGLSGPFGVLADMLTDAHDAQRLTAVIDHFWENRRIGNVLFAGPSRQVAMRTLATLIEQRLAATRGPSTLPMPPSLLAVQLAGGQLALISGWLSGLAPATPGQIATALVGSVNWLTGPPPVQGAMRLTVNAQPDPAPSS
jgi:AcrR family transcriptional regulator